MNRKQMINDLDKAHREQNDIDSMSDGELREFHKRFGRHFHDVEV